jgi:hypothetical protein
VDRVYGLSTKTLALLKLSRLNQGIELIISEEEKILSRRVSKLTLNYKTQTCLKNSRVFIQKNFLARKGNLTT